MTLIEDIEKYFGTKVLYDVIGTKNDADEEEIKRAYRKTSLKVHPDRMKEEDKEKATRKFQVLAQVHHILSDKEKRKLYDDHGIIANDDSLESEADWLNYWRILFPEISVKDVDHFMEDYIGSKDEERDLIEIYNRFEGDMNMIYEYHIGFEEERITKLLKKLIKKGKIENLPKFSEESESSKEKRSKRTAKEAKQAAKAATKKNKQEDDAALTALIRNRKSNFDSMIASLESKYAPKQPKGVKRKRTERK